MTVEHVVPTFFMKVFGFDTVTIKRTSVAEYVLPLAMGSDKPYFGAGSNGPGVNGSNFWANIHGYYTGPNHGRPIFVTMRRRRKPKHLYCEPGASPDCLSSIEPRHG